MILPSTYYAAIACLAVSLLCWGSWANLQKLSGRWRYELFFWDFSLGVMLVAVLAAFTLGLLDSKELTFQDNLLIASYHKIAYGLAAGVVFNLANLFLVGAISVAPLSVVFPVATGVGLIVGGMWGLAPPQQGSLLLLLGGAAVLAVAMVVNAFTYSQYAQEQRNAKLMVTPDTRPAGKPGVPAKSPKPSKGIFLSVVSGVLLGMLPPLIDLCRTGEDGLGAYAAGLLVGIATLISTLTFTPFFIVFAVQGAPVQVRTYFKGSKMQHLYGLLSGGLWSGGLIASFSTGGALALVQIEPVTRHAFEAGAAVLATLSGLLFWREFGGSSYRVRMLLAAMVILWVIGAGMMVMAPGITK